MTQQEYQLEQNHPLRLEHAAGQRIDCLHGTAWITAYGENTDFMLRAGQSFEIPNDGLTLVEAVGASRIRVRGMPDMAPGWAQRLQHRLSAALR